MYISRNQITEISNLPNSLNSLIISDNNITRISNLPCDLTYIKYDIDKAVSYIKTHAEKKSTSLCAKYVRLAIEAGGLESSAVKRNAQNYLTILKDLGFTEEETTSYIKGDIVVFGIPKGHDNGHIAMYTGSEWISDFKQNSIIVNDVYTNAKKTIFRWK